MALALGWHGRQKPERPREERERKPQTFYSNLSRGSEDLWEITGKGGNRYWKLEAKGLIRESDDFGYAAVGEMNLMVLLFPDTVFRCHLSSASADSGELCAGQA